MINRLGIEMLSGLGLPPIALVELAADLGCVYVSTGLMQLPAQYNPLGYPDWSLLTDPALRREVRAVMRDRGISISLGEGFAVRPGAAMAGRAHEMDIMAELGARGLGAVSMEPDTSRACDEFAMLAAMASARGMLTTIEFAPGLAVATLAQALEFVQHVGTADCGLLVDSMHFFRTGGSIAELAAVDPRHILYAQLSDSPWGYAGPDYGRESMFARLVPGDGELPLADLIALLPPTIPIGLEVPMLAVAQAGVSAHERLAPAVSFFRNLPGAKPC